MNNALVLFETEPGFREELKGILSGYNVIFNESNNIASIDAENAGSTEIIFGNPKADFLKICPRLKWLQLQSAGANGFIDGEVNDTVLLTSATGCYGHAVSEHMAALTFELAKKLHLYRDNQSAHSWQSRGSVKSIQDAVVVVIGFGDIGTNYARRMKGLGAYVIAVDRNAYAKPDYLDEFLLSDRMDDALKRADVVALAVPGIKTTVGLIGRSALAKMKKDAVIVNACRGPVIDTEALCDALESGALAGAGLDVTDPEPLPAGHRLWKIENAVITPHVAGGRHLSNTGRNIMKLCLENASRYVKGQTLKSRIDFKTGFCIPEKQGDDTGSIR